ncbi:hypothetical protein BO86DRAFT_62416 [Aspergillus japonicus CBS 114.51]|uniref:Uncharacterized protein n=1 Tax=Aspergillus japonicus CBS 114.51 TaxID=1448312 RepID=A0A8T8X5X2_ASPJA|nr:hypothetical protein BO86DRAFT_62416 [Aspergillus japonicus CBS 114.51]RAH82849.1 hypothetical protein BO86DRAFT_62416 [Aspergillus japonicus CBS 114.51]
MSLSKSRAMRKQKEGLTAVSLPLRAMDQDLQHFMEWWTPTSLPALHPVPVPHTSLPPGKPGSADGQAYMRLVAQLLVAHSSLPVPSKELGAFGCFSWFVACCYRCVVFLLKDGSERSSIPWEWRNSNGGRGGNGAPSGSDGECLDRLHRA